MDQLSPFRSPCLVEKLWLLGSITALLKIKVSQLGLLLRLLCFEYLVFNSQVGIDGVDLLVVLRRVFQRETSSAVRQIALEYVVARTNPSSCENIFYWVGYHPERYEGHEHGKGFVRKIVPSRIIYEWLQFEKWLSTSQPQYDADYEGANWTICVWIAVYNAC